MKPSFTNPGITPASYNDLAAITTLLNTAYRGESSRQGWTHEEHLIDGNVRTTEESLKKIIEQEDSILLKYTANGAITGCVNLQLHADRLYLGMLAVSPGLQGGGIGKQLLNAAEEYAEQLHCSSIYMTVISVRHELVDWYKRHGYKDTGQLIPFEEDSVTGRHRQPLEFMVMEKSIR